MLNKMITIPVGILILSLVNGAYTAPFTKDAVVARCAPGDAICARACGSIVNCRLGYLPGALAKTNSKRLFKRQDDFGDFSDDSDFGGDDSGDFGGDFGDDSGFSDNSDFGDSGFSDDSDSGFDDSGVDSSGSFDDGSGSFDDGSFDDGSGSFDDGSGSFDDGSGSFDDGTGSVDDGSGSFDDGFSDDQNGDFTGGDDTTTDDGTGDDTVDDTGSIDGSSDDTTDDAADATADDTATDDADDSSATDTSTADDAATSSDADDDTTDDASTTDSASAAAPTASDAASQSGASKGTSNANKGSSNTGNTGNAANSQQQSGATCGANSGTVNQATVNLIKQFEGFVPKPAPDPIGLPTVGFGHKCTSKGCAEVPFSFPLSQGTASQLLQNDLGQFVSCVNKAVSNSVQLTDNQVGALSSFAFNLGCGTLQKSTLLKRLNGGEDPNTVAAQEIPKFNKAGGKVLSGLQKRRAAEVALFQTPSDVLAHPC